MEPGGNQGALPVARPARRRAITPEDTLLAYEGGMNHGPDPTKEGFPLPKKAPEFEGTVWKYDKENDDTGDELGNLIKRAIYNIQNYIAATRRKILPLLPITKHTGKQVHGLAVELTRLESKLADKLEELHQIVDTDLQKPGYFINFPALKD